MSTHGEVVSRMQCPECATKGNDTNGDNLVVYESGYGKCFACNFFDYNLQGATGKPVKKKDPLPFIEEIFYRDLKSRGIRKDVAQHYGYGYGKFYNSDVQVAPFIDDTGKLIGQKLRFKSKTFVWTGKSTRRFFGQHLYQKNKRLCITEGELDCLSVSQVIGTNWPVVSLPSGAGLHKVKAVIQENLQYLQRFEEIILFMDDDDEGRAAIEAFAEFLPGKCKAARYPVGYKDANAMLIDGKHAEIKQAYWNASTIENDSDDFKTPSQYTREDFKSIAKKGYTLPFNGLYEAIRGLRPAETTTFTAGSGIGKSSILRQIGHFLVKEHGLKVGNIFMEEQDAKTLLAYMALDLMVNSADLLDNFDEMVSDEMIKEFADKYDGNLVNALHSVSWQYDKLIAKIEHMALAQKCDFIILDHISIAVAGMDADNEARAIEKLMRELYRIAEHTGVGILTVVHLRKPDGDKDWLDGTVPTANHLKGSSALAQYSHNIIAASRNATDDDQRLFTYLHLLKCRHYGENTGKCVSKLKYNTETGILEDFEKFPSKPTRSKKQIKGYNKAQETLKEIAEYRYNRYGETKDDEDN